MPIITVEIMKTIHEKKRCDRRCVVTRSVIKTVNDADECQRE